MPDFPCIFKTTVNFPLSVCPPMSFQDRISSPSIVCGKFWLPSRLTQTRYARQKGECPIKVCLLHNSGNLSKLAEQQPALMSQRNLAVYRVPPLVQAAQRPAPRLCFVVARGGEYCFGGGGNGSRTGSGLILARIAFRVLMRGDMK